MLNAQLSQCPNCDGTGTQKNVFGGALYAAGYSDHGHTTFTTCEICNGKKVINNQQLINYLGIDETEVRMGEQNPG